MVNKKTVGIISGMVLTMSLLSPVATNAKEFIDVPETNIFYENLSNLFYMEVMSGYSPNNSPYDDISMKPYNPVTRAQASKMIALSMGLGHTTQENAPFHDVGGSYWGHDYITLLHNEGVVNGKTPTSFTPNDGLTRAQAAKMIANAFNLNSDTSYLNEFNDVDSSSWEAPYVNALLQNNITTGTTPTTFSPLKQVTRSQLADCESSLILNSF